MLRLRGPDTVRISKVKGPADDGMVLDGRVRELILVGVLCQSLHKIACHFWFGDVFINGKPHMLALARPSLHGNYACMVYWTKGALRRSCRQKQRETSFLLLLEFFCSVAIPGKGSGVWYSGIYGLGVLGILGQPPCPDMWVLRFLM